MLGWLDLDEEDERRARDCLRQIEVGGAVDELGFGILRDAFAERFFPATNTVMTRTRYLFFVAAAHVRLEHERVRAEEVTLRLELLQDQIRERLERSERHGVIGRLSKEQLDRYPHSIYWRSLKQLGLFTHPTWRQAYYHAHLRELSDQRAAVLDDDGMAHSPASVNRTWDPALEEIIVDGRSVLTAGLELPEELHFHLTKAEARYLAERFAEMASREGDSLLSYLLAERFAATFDYPWETPRPTSLESQLHHARLLSMFAKGATLMYYHVLLAARRDAGLSTPAIDLNNAFEAWWGVARDELVRWVLGDFFQLARAMGALRNDVMFMQQWVQRCARTQSAKALLSDSQARTLVRQRELQKKAGKARLGNAEALRRWRPPTHLDELAAAAAAHAPYWLNYRSDIGQTFVREILDGLARGQG